MDASIFKFILRFSMRQQMILLAVTAVSMPVLYLSLELPKIIVNEALSGVVTEFEVFGRDVERLDYLFLLSGLFLVLVFVNGGIKYFINVYRGVMAERMLRRLRYMLINRVFRFPSSRFRTTSSGEVVAMVVQETEPVGGFFGEALSLPAFQGGTLLTILTFMFIQDPILGAAAISLYPLQAYLIPKLQRRVNALAKQRVAAARKLSERIGETVEGVRDVHLHGTAQYELSDFGDRLGRLFDIRKRIYILKFFIKFLNNFLNQLTPFFFYSIGGYLVITGDLTIGALVAILAAYKDISAPWKELLAYYQRMEDTRIKYEQVIQQFEPSDIHSEDTIEFPAKTGATIGGALRANNLSVLDEDGRAVLSGISVDVPMGTHAALLGTAGSGRSEFLQVLARLIPASRGTLHIGDTSIAGLSDLVLGRSVTYLDHEAFIRAGTIGDNLFYGMMQGPPSENHSDPVLFAESEYSGNSPYSSESNWLDPLELDQGALFEKALISLRNAGLEEDIFSLGLRSVLDEDDAGSLAERVLQARREVNRAIAESDVADAFEVFHRDAYNHNASVGENILFGAPLDERLSQDSIAEYPIIKDVLARTGLDNVFIRKGAEVAALLADIFNDLPSGHEFFERFSFFDPEDLAEYKRLSSLVTDKGPDGLKDEEQQILVSLVFKLIPAKHRLGVIDERTQVKLLEARRLFAELATESEDDTVVFFDIQEYNPAGTVGDNLLFGRLSEAHGDAEEKVLEIVTDVAENTGLYNDIVRVGLKYDVGISGKRLTPGQRQKLALARAMVKEPSIMLINDAFSVFDPETKRKLEQDVRTAMQGRSVLYGTAEIEDSAAYDQVHRFAQGRLVTDGGEQLAPQPAEPEKTTEKEGVGSELRDEAEVLRQIPFFESMSQSDLMLLAFSSERVKFEEGDIVVRQGELGAKAFVIIEGEADVLLDATGEEEFLTVRRRGDLVGELALLTEAPRTATLRARTPLELLEIDRDVFMKLLEDSPAVSISVLRTISRRFEATLRGMSGGEQLFDADTRLPNAANIRQQLGRLGGNPVILISFDAPEKVIDEIGAATENRFFKKVVRRIRNALGEADILGRTAYGDFAAMIADEQKDADQEAVRAAISASLLEPMYFGARTLELRDHPFDVRITTADVALAELGAQQS